MRTRCMALVIVMTVCGCAASTHHQLSSDIRDPDRSVRGLPAGQALTADTTTSGSASITCKDGRLRIKRNRLRREREFTVTLTGYTIATGGFVTNSDCPISLILVRKTADGEDVEPIPDSETAPGQSDNIDVAIPAGRDLVIKCGGDDNTKRCRFIWSLTPLD